MLYKFSILVITTLLLITIAPVASANEIVSIGTYSTSINSNVTVPITIYNASNIAGGSLKVSFDSSILSVEEVKVGDFGSPVSNIKPSSVYIATASTAAIGKDKAILANIIFRANKNGVSELNIENASLNDEDGTIIIPDITNGTIKVGTAPLLCMGDYEVNVNSEVTIPIIVKNASNVAGGSLKVSFDPSIVNAENVSSGDFGMPEANIKEGYVYIAVAAANSVGKNEAILANINFKGLSEGNTPLNIGNANLNDENGNLIFPMIVNGSLEVNKKSLCFIATAAYGTPLHEDIEVLRDFRDKVLMQTLPGRTLVTAYYSTSPPIANALRKNDGLRSAVRLLLITPLVYLTKMILNGIGLFALVLLGLGAFFGAMRGLKVVLNAIGLGISTIVVLIGAVFTLGWLAYAYPVCAVIAACILPIIISVAVSVMIFVLIKKW